jgi:hypothetical protein
MLISIDSIQGGLKNLRIAANARHGQNCEGEHCKKKPMHAGEPAFLITTLVPRIEKIICQGCAEAYLRELAST